MYNSLDVICAAAFLVLGLFGYHIGAVASIFYIASGFVGVFVAQKYAATLHVNFIVLFVVVTLGLIAFGMFSRALARLFLLGFIDRLAGFVIGVVLGTALLSVALGAVCEKLPEPAQKKIEASYVAKHVVPVAMKKLPGLRDLSETVCNKAGGICK